MHPHAQHHSSAPIGAAAADAPPAAPLTDAARNAAARAPFDSREDAETMRVALAIAQGTEPVWRKRGRTGDMQVEDTGAAFGEDLQARAAWLADDSLIERNSSKVDGRRVLAFANERLALVMLRHRQREQALAAVDLLGDAETLSLALAIARGDEPVARLVTEQHMAHSGLDGDWIVFGPKQIALAEIMAASRLVERPSRRYLSMVALQFQEPTAALASLQACLERYAQAAFNADADERLLSIGLAMAQAMEPVKREHASLPATYLCGGDEVQFNEADIARLAWLAGEPIVERASAQTTDASALAFRNPRVALEILKARVRALNDERGAERDAEHQAQQVPA